MNSQSFHGQCYIYNKFSHKANECKSKMTRNSSAMTSQSFYGYCYTCNKFGHRVANCRSNIRKSNFAPQTSIICYNCHKLGYIARFCKEKNARSFSPQKKYIIGQQKKEMNKVW